MSERLAKLQKLLERDPADPFLLYGVAMEYKKAGDARSAIDYLDRTIAAEPAYCYALFQKGQIQELQGDLEGARASYRAGIDAAKIKGDDHARSEIEDALSMIE